MANKYKAAQKDYVSEPIEKALDPCPRCRGSKCSEKDCGYTTFNPHWIECDDCGFEVKGGYSSPRTLWNTLSSLRVPAEIMEAFYRIVSKKFKGEDIKIVATALKSIEPVDVEGLKKETDQRLFKIWCEDGQHKNHHLANVSTALIGSIIDHLASQGHLTCVKKEPETLQWQPIETAPRDGTKFYARFMNPFMWKPYKPNSQQFKSGKKGRWQMMNDYGGWDNTDYEPHEWINHKAYANLTKG